MKRLRYILLFSVLGIMLWSCEDSFLDVKNVKAGVTVDDMYSRYNYVQGVVWETYSYLPDGLSDLWREASTDIAEATYEGNESQLFNIGIWNPLINPDDVWSHYFQGINQANSYLAYKGEADLEYIMTSATQTDSTNYYKAVNNLKFMEGEVLFLKAFFYFELVKRYGGVPIFKEALVYEDESTWKDIERNSLDECIKYITELCDASSKIIPKDMSNYTWYEDGRVTYGAIKALKTKVMLYAASPLFKENGSTISWENAAAAAHDVIALGQYSLGSNYASLFGPSNASSKEFIFKKRYGSNNSTEYSQYPISFVGSKGYSLTPTQNFVDQFEVVNSDGTCDDFDWNNPAHNADPYANRDLRLEATVLHNGELMRGVTIETFTGGNNGLPKQNASKTGYYLSKWVNVGIDLVNNTSADHTWCYFRYADILLSYAEAMYNAYGADADPKGYGLTAIDAFNMVRSRAKVEILPSSELNQNRIERERLVEFAYEDQRSWDVRRWKKGEQYFNVPVTKVVITNTDAGFNYKVEELEKRVFSEKMNWYPIPKSEIIKTGWDQNPLWE